MTGKCLSDWHQEVSDIVVGFTGVSRHFIGSRVYSESDFSEKVMTLMVITVQSTVNKNQKGVVMFAIAIAIGITPQMLRMIAVCIHCFLILWLSTTRV